jgi:selenocysteine-specific elongation factor
MQGSDPEAASPAPALRVVATAGHVDHGKSALILRLTGLDPDRLAEEKRRGLTIDLGFAWATLPSGREIGFVDVPGHERFVRNMLAGVGPVRLVLFVVAADEGWKPQSEEHLAIVDVLGIQGGVVALTKSDLVPPDQLATRIEEVRGKLAGTGLAGAPILPCSSVTGDGLEDLRTALDAMLGAASPPESAGRPRQFIDRVFSIRGAGTVVTGTLTGGSLSVGDEAEVLPAGHRARIRGLQTHKHALQRAEPVSRVAINLAGTTKEEIERGDVLTVPGQWRATRVVEVRLRPVRGLDHPLTPRGAYKLYAGSAEREARLRLYGSGELGPGEESFARLTLSRPVVLDVGDGFVLREAGRQQTVAGGVVLDCEPPARPGPETDARLRARSSAKRGDLAWLLVRERGAVRAREITILTGAPAGEAARGGAIPIYGWVVDRDAVDRSAERLTSMLRTFHDRHPLRPGLELGEARRILMEGPLRSGDPGAADALLALLLIARRLVRDGTTIRLPEHRPSTEGREDADRLVAAIREGEPSPPTVRELEAGGFDSELIRATCSEGRLVRVSAELVITPGLLAEAERVLRDLASESVAGITVSSFRERLGTSRKYALPILELFDARGVTRRQGDVRVLREAGT